LWSYYLTQPWLYYHYFSFATKGCRTQPTRTPAASHPQLVMHQLYTCSICWCTHAAYAASHNLLVVVVICCTPSAAQLLHSTTQPTFLFCFASLLAQAKGGTPFAVIKRNIAAHWTNLQVVVHHLILAHNTAF